MGALVLFLTCTALSAPFGYRAEPMYVAREEVLGLPGPREQIAGLIDLPDGYHKHARVHIGTLVSVAMFDTGSFRSCFDEDLLTELEGRQQKKESGKRAVISLRRECHLTHVDVVANGYMTTY